ncbi:MAG TPA: PAS domain-containing protein, partial [Aquabacterium sp.]|nr:PAS domain-containing protein [Aquabacterium sp.]
MSTLFASGVAHPGMPQPTAAGQEMDVSPIQTGLLFDASPAPQLILASEGHILAANRAAAQLLRLPQSDLRGRGLQALIPDLD